MLFYHFLFGFVATAIVNASASNRPSSPRKFDEDEVQFRKELYGTSKRSSALRKKLMKKAKFIPPPHGLSRGLQNDDGFSSWMSNYVSGGGGNYYSKDYEGYEYEASQGDTQWEQRLGFEPTQVSLSYHRCATVRQFDDEFASQQYSDATLATKSFAVFRFCPSKTCDPKAVDEDLSGNDQINDDAQEVDEDAQSQSQGGRTNWWGGKKVYGARGRGCSSNYGEYLVALEDYLQMVAEWQQDRVENYCKVCQDYMYQLYMEYINEGNGRRDLTQEEFRAGRALSDIGECIYYSNICADNNAAQEKYELTEYFECKLMNNYYVGPHCGQDGYTITLGLFADEGCNDYIGSNVETVLGEELEEDALKPWYNSGTGILDDLFAGDTSENLCFPCNQDGDVVQSVIQSLSEAMYYGDYEDQGYMNYGSSDPNYMNELCESVYKTSARCNMHYKNYRKMKLSESDRAEMELTCAYIDSVKARNYNELGFVNLKGDKQRGTYVENQSSSNHSSRNVTPLQIFGLLAAMLCCIILAIWSKSLHTSLTKGEEWAPGAIRSPRDWSIFRKPEEVERMDSGIGRVRSDGSYYAT